MTTRTRAATYVRVSTEEQVDGTSLTVQQQSCRRVIEQHGWDCVDAFGDEGVSGALANRPGLDQLLDACRRHEIDVVVVARLDRLGRSLRHLSATLGELDDLGIQLVSVHEAFDSLGPSGRLQRNILSSFAQFEREQMVERVTSGLDAKARAGWWPGGPAPFGYRLVREGRHHRLAIDEREAEAIRVAVGVLVDEGGTTSDAARTLNALGYRPRKAARWRYNHLRRFLLGAQLTGTWLYGRKAAEGRNRTTTEPAIELTVPPILTAERQLALFERLEASRIPRQATAQSHFYLLGGGRITSPCGHHFHGLYHQSTHRRKYLCPGRRHFLDDTCQCRILDAETIEAEIWRSVTQLLTDPVRLACCRPGDQITLIGPAPSLDESIAAASRDVAAARADLVHAAVELVQARLSGGAIAAATEELSARLRDAEAHRDQLLRRREDATDSGRLAVFRRDADLVAARLVRLDPAHRRALLDMLALSATVSSWTECSMCRGKGRLSGGVRCPSCAGGRHVPDLVVTCWWADDAYTALAS
jgi:DNA invertase Pin-like site-specific DNA recombinase